MAVAEHIAGSEAEFVEKMNAKAKELGMNNTHFVDCCGLTDSDDHYTTARDVAIMESASCSKTTFPVEASIKIAEGASMFTCAACVYRPHCTNNTL